MKTKEELNAIREEFAALKSRLAELSEEELAQVTGGDIDIRKDLYENIILGACAEDYRGGMTIEEIISK